MSFGMFLLQLVAMLILTGSLTAMFLLGIFWVMDQVRR